MMRVQITMEPEMEPELVDDVFNVWEDEQASA